MSDTNAADRVLIEGLAVETVIGVYGWERNIRQSLVFDIEMQTDISRAAQTDDLEYTLDYDAVSRAVIALAENSEYQLVESLAEALAAMIVSEFSVSWLKLKVSKPNALSAARNVAVQIERSAD